MIIRSLLGLALVFVLVPGLSQATDPCVTVSSSQAPGSQTDAFLVTGNEQAVTVVMTSHTAGANVQYYNGSSWLTLNDNVEVSATRIRLTAPSSGQFVVHYTYVDPCSGAAPAELIFAVA